MPVTSSKPKPISGSVPRPRLLQVMRFRGSLDWLLSLPRWETAFGLSISELGLPGGRQGINRTAAMRSLRVEQKYALLRHALAGGLEIPSHSEVRALARQLGLSSYQSRPDFERPSSKQWEDLTQKILLRLSNLYSKYKDSQSELYFQFHRLPELIACEICRSPTLLDDAKQEARLGLLDAIDHIGDQGSFEAYARHWIKRRVQNLLMRSKLPVSAPINLISKTLRQEKGANRALAKAMREGTVSLDEASPDQVPRTEILAEPAYDPILETEFSDIQENIRIALRSLTEKQREVVELRFGFQADETSLSLAEIASQTGISRQQVHQREKRALHQLAQILRQPARELQFHLPGSNES